MDANLTIRGLKKHFGDNKVLDGIDLDVSDASVTTIIGKSGIGKSVLLKCISGLVRPDAGQIEVNGEPITSARGTPADGAHCFSYMFQNNALFDSLTAYDNIALPLLETTKLKAREIREQVEDILEKVELSDSANRFPGELSGGMKKRVALARALVTKPRSFSLTNQRPVWIPNANSPFSR